jgi:hypothetical protein
MNKCELNGILKAAVHVCVVLESRSFYFHYHDKLKYFFFLGIYLTQNAFNTKRFFWSLEIRVKRIPLYV